MHDLQNVHTVEFWLQNIHTVGILAQMSSDAKGFGALSGNAVDRLLTSRVAFGAVPARAGL